MELTKELIASRFGCEIDEFDLEPIFVDGKIVAMSVIIKPRNKLNYVNTTLVAGKSSDFNIDDEDNDNERIFFW